MSTAVTNSSGGYTFSELPGTYTITVPSTCCTGNLPLLSSNKVQVTVTGGNSASVSFQYAATPPPPPPPPAAVSHGDTATIGFWHNKNGQGLINSLNGGPTATNLAMWLATNFPYLWGGTAPTGSNLTGKTNADVAALALTYFNVHGAKTNLQMLGAALAVYVTNSTLAGNTASGYGFNVSSNGTGMKVFNVGSNGKVIGLTNNASYSVMQLLQQANTDMYNGTFNANAFNSIFDGINQTGDIS
jgi:hypothetical protein